MKHFFVYILSNHTRSVFYIGVTNDLAQRLSQHRGGWGSRFALKYNLKSLVYWEEFADPHRAIMREKQLKNWHRDWKIELIRSVNPEMRDLSDEIPMD